MAEKLEDLNLPQSAVLKIIKEAIPGNINVGKDVKSALAKAASIFIIYISSQSTQCAQNAKRKTITQQDIFEALEEAEFGHFIGPLKEELAEYNENRAKQKSDKPKKDGNLEAAADDEDIDDEEEAEADTEEVDKDN